MCNAVGAKLWHGLRLSACRMRKLHTTPLHGETNLWPEMTTKWGYLLESGQEIGILGCMAEVHQRQKTRASIV